MSAPWSDIARLIKVLKDAESNYAAKIERIKSRRFRSENLQKRRLDDARARFEGSNRQVRREIARIGRAAHKHAA